MHPYRAFRILKWTTFFPFSYRIFGMLYGFTSHMISTNSPSKLRLTSFSLGMSAFKYAHGTSNITTSWPSYVSTTNVEISSSRVIVGYEASSLGISPLYVLPSPHVHPLILPHIFSFISFHSSKWFYIFSWFGHIEVLRAHNIHIV